jgi:hypothetical protein
MLGREPNPPLVRCKKLHSGRLQSYIISLKNVWENGPAYFVSQSKMSLDCSLTEWSNIKQNDTNQNVTLQKNTQPNGIHQNDINQIKMSLCRTILSLMAFIKMIISIIVLRLLL